VVYFQYAKHSHWETWQKVRKTSLNIDGKVAKTRTRYLLYIRLACCLYTSLFVSVVLTDVFASCHRVNFRSYIQIIYRIKLFCSDAILSFFHFLKKNYQSLFNISEGHKW
jgi:hypothetical protein